VILDRVLHLFPAGGRLLGLSGAALAVAAVDNSLIALGIGLYASCLVLVSLLGLNPIAAFPVMMGSSAFLMLIGSLLFIGKRKYDLRAAPGRSPGSCGRRPDIR
jgi:3-hydroxyisobutyrate dehydrogenase-like beta-hydroxyacid dehydrogenase